jgi:hypothetical protein
MWIIPVRRLAWLEVTGRGHRGVAGMEADLKYYRRRSAEEAAAAAAATNPKVRATHLEFASRYRDRIRTLEALHEPAPLHLVSLV